MIRSHRRRGIEAAPAADVYHGMAYMGISVALALGRRHHARVVYDARDIYMAAANLARLGGPIKAVLARMERGWARAADRVFTVNQPYAEQLAGRFGVETPVIVMNCSYRFSPPTPAPRRFHERLGLDPATRVVLYQGGFSRGRGIEELIAAIHLVPNAVLVAMGYGALETEIRAAAMDPRNRGKVHVLPAVPPTELLDWVASADVVGVLFQHDTLNNYLSTPNKFLEAMAAGVPSVCSDHPGMAPIARATGCGTPVDPSNIEAIGGRDPRDRGCAARRTRRAARPCARRGARHLQLGDPGPGAARRVHPADRAPLVTEPAAEIPRVGPFAVRGRSCSSPTARPRIRAACVSGAAWPRPAGRSRSRPSRQTAFRPSSATATWSPAATGRAVPSRAGSGSPSRHVPDGGCCDSSP